MKPSDKLDLKLSLFELSILRDLIYQDGIKQVAADVIENKLEVVKADPDLTKSVIAEALVRISHAVDMAYGRAMDNQELLDNVAARRAYFDQIFG